MAYEAMVYCTDHNLSDGRVDSSVAGREGAVCQYCFCGDEKGSTDL